MRVGLVSPYSLSLPGGVQGQVLALARALNGSGHYARVLGPCDGPPPAAFVTPLGNSLPTAANGSLAPLAPDPAAALRTIRALRDEEFDVLHVHEPLAPGPTVTTLLLKPAPLIGTFHAAGGSRAYDWLKFGLRRLASRLDLRVAVSLDAQRMASETLGGDYDVLWNGVDLAQVRAAKPYPCDRPTIFFIARHEPRKGLAVLLDALAHLGPDVRLWIGGVGPETAELRARAAGDPRVEWLGPISDTEKFARLRGATVFCAPSLHGESFGIVLIEAMAAGTPIVATSLPGYRSVTRDGTDAALVGPGDARALAEALQGLLADPARRRELAASGCARAEQFSIERLAEAYIERYQRIARL